jgi:ribonuclease BN (tRNA processing enzyme)
VSTLDLNFVGTGNAFAPTRYWSSFIANGKYLFDAPPTLLPHLRKLDIDPRDIEVIFISHFHGDHYFGLPFALLEFAEKEPRTKDLTIVGPPGIKGRVEASTNLAFANVFRKRDRGYPLTFVEARNEREARAGGCSYVPYRVQHVPDLESFGFDPAFYSGLYRVEVPRAGGLPSDTLSFTGTPTWSPIAHHRLLEQVESSLMATGLQVVNQAHHAHHPPSGEV